MLDEVKNIDAITVSTPDHMHATVALTAMLQAKHVYVQKPLAKTVHEARVMRQVATKQKVVTQMGIQFHSSVGYRCLVKLRSMNDLAEQSAGDAEYEAPSVEDVETLEGPAVTAAGAPTGL